MKRTAKKCLVACLVLSLLLAMLPMISVSAATPALDIITDVEFKTIEIRGNMPENAGEMSLVIMDASYEGDFSGVFENVDKIVALDQLTVAADGAFTYNTVLDSVVVDAAYKLFLNGVEVDSIVFDAPIGVMAGDQIAVPIFVRNCTDFAGLIGNLNYDPEYFTLESITAADGYLLQSIGTRFAVVTEDGMGVDGNNVVGWALLTVSSDLEEGAPLTTVSYTIDNAYKADGSAADVRTEAYKFEILDPVLPGDVDLDGDVDLADAILLLQYLSQNATLSAKALRAADILADGIVNTADAVVIMQVCL